MSAAPSAGPLTFPLHLFVQPRPLCLWHLLQPLLHDSLLVLLQLLAVRHVLPRDQVLSAEHAEGWTWTHAGLQVVEALRGLNRCC